MGPLEAAVGVADVIRHEVTLFDPAFLLQRQLAKHLPEVLLRFSVEHLPAGLGNEHHMLFALPPVGLTLVIVHREAPFMCLAAHESGVSAVDDCRKCRTATATPAEPGDLLWMLAKPQGRST